VNDSDALREALCPIAYGCGHGPITREPDINTIVF